MRCFPSFAPILIVQACLLLQKPLAVYLYPPFRAECVSFAILASRDDDVLSITRIYLAWIEICVSTIDHACECYNTFF